MNKLWILVGFPFLIGVGSTAAQMQKEPPALLLDAVYCATSDHGGWLNPSLNTESPLKAGFARDRKSYENEEHLILVVHEKASSGQAFDIVLARGKNRTKLHMVNNAGYKIGAGSFEWTDAPLGGVWTQGHFKRNIERANSSGTYIIDAALIRSRKQVSCSSYVNAK